MKKITIALFCLSVGLIYVTVCTRAAIAAEAAELPVNPAFVALPPGAVEPTGWLRDWALAARNGITGHLDECHTTFCDAWKGIPIQAGGAKPDGTGWPLEQCSYWLDGLVQLGYVLHDDVLIQKAQSRLNMIVDGVNKGGGSFIYWKTEKPTEFNSWAHSHMGRALAAWYEATRDKRILDAMVKTYSDYTVPMGHVRSDTDCGVSGLCNIDTMLRAYTWSHDRRLLDGIRAAINTPENQATIEQWLDNKFLSGHTVITYEQIRLPALCYLATGEQKYLQASRNAFRWIEEHHMQPHGVASGEEYLSGIGAMRGTETCDIAAQMWSSSWLYQITGERAWGDSIERAFFNAGAGSVARDWKTMCYYQAPNHMSQSLPGGEAHRYRFTKLGDPGGVLCCVGNVNRLIPNYITNMWMATPDHGLAATLYGPCSVKAVVVENIPVKLTCETNYPFEETIRVLVDPQRSASFPLYFRIPAWCSNPRISVNGEPVNVGEDKNGFTRIERRWTGGDAVEIVFPMSVQVARGFETEYPAAAKPFYFSPKDPSLFEKRRLPYEAVSYGPLLFALPIADVDANTPVADSKWQYALDNDAQRKGRDIKVERQPMPATWNWSMDAPIKLKVPAKEFDWHPTDVQALPNSTVEGAKDEILTLVPYGCTKFRISMFPVTRKAWGNGSPQKTPSQ